jgi:hypothetical protein
VPTGEKSAAFISSAASYRIDDRTKEVGAAIGGQKVEQKRELTISFADGTQAVFESGAPDY